MVTVESVNHARANQCYCKKMTSEEGSVSEEESIIDEKSISGSSGSEEEDENDVVISNLGELVIPNLEKKIK